MGLLFSASTIWARGGSGGSTSSGGVSPILPRPNNYDPLTASPAFSLRPNGIADFILLGFIGTIAITGVVMIMRQKSPQSAPEPLSVPPQAQRAKAELEAIGQQDSRFDPTQLIARLKEIFLTLQASWTARNYSPMKALMSPMIYRKHLELMDRMRSRGEINQMEPIQLERVEPVYYERRPGDARNLVTFFVQAKMADFITNEAGSLVRGDRNVRVVQEYWTLERNEGAWVLLKIEPITAPVLDRPNINQDEPWIKKGKTNDGLDSYTIRPELGSGYEFANYIGDDDLMGRSGSFSVYALLESDGRGQWAIFSEHSGRRGNENVRYILVSRVSGIVGNYVTQKLAQAAATEIARSQAPIKTQPGEPSSSDR